MKLEHKIRTYTRWWYLLIGITGLLVFGMIVYSYHKSIRIITVYAPLIDAAMDIKFEAAMAHLWFEEIISGDRHENIETVWKRLDQADWYARAMLEGETNYEGTFIPLDDAEMQQKILNVRAKLSEFRKITEQRFVKQEISGPGTDIDQLYDIIFKEFITQADKVENRLQQVMKRDLSLFRYTQIMLIVIISILSLVVGIVYYRFEHRRTKDAITIHHSNEELIKYRYHLETLVEKRTRELRGSQKKLIDAERLAVLGKLSGGIAHEIRNPLGVIDSSVYYLKSKLKDADEKTRSHLDRITKQVKNSTAIIQSLQDLAKMKEPRKTRVDIANVIEDGINNSNMPKAVKVIMNIPEGELFADVDIKQISIVFTNILINAIQAMDNKGTIWINTYKTNDKLLEISFKDSGPGILPEDLGNIFKLFYGTKAKGIGFGLTMCQMIVERHKGKIEANSGPGKGVTFIVRLPFTEAGN